MNGYIKLHRSIMDWRWYDDPNTFRMFVHLLLKANHAAKDWRRQGWRGKCCGATLLRKNRFIVRSVRTALNT